MAQRTQGGTPGGSSRGGTGGSRGSRRVSAAPVKKPFPWGFTVGAVVLVLFLAAIMGYAVSHTGAGFKTAADKADAAFKGLEVTKNPSANHVTTRIAYPGEATQAPDAGNHNPTPQTCAVYGAPVVPEHAVHSLEHGAVWITYRPNLPADQVDVLKALVEGNSYRMLSPYPGQTSPVALQAWGRRLDVPSATDPRVARFADTYTNGPQTREQGAACAGIDEPGTVPFVLSNDGQTYVPGDATATVPAEGKVPSGAPGSAAPGAPAPEPAGGAAGAPAPVPSP